MKNMSDSAKALNANALNLPYVKNKNNEIHKNNIIIPEIKDMQGKGRINTLNKTERRYYDSFLAEEINSGVNVIIQPTRFFELTGGGSYTPDFIIIRDYGIEVVEIKGGYKGPGWEQGIERYKRAATQYDNQCTRFKMATWKRSERVWDVVVWKKR